MRTKELPARRSGPQIRGLSPKAARIKADLSGERLAALVPCSASLVWTCERTGRFPSHPLIRAPYLAALGITEADAAEVLTRIDVLHVRTCKKSVRQ